MPSFKKDTIEKLAAKRVDALHFDEKAPGFFLRTYKSGAPAVFGVKYSVGGKPRRMNLGRATPETLASMRELAETVRAKAKLGQDTLGEQQVARAKPRTATLGKVVPMYLKARKDDLRERSYGFAHMYLTKHWKPLHGMAIDEIKRKDVVRVVDDIAEKRGRVAADRARTALSTFFMWAIDRSYVENNPTMHIKERAPSGSRERVLSEDELVAVWKACEDDDFGKIVKLLILTGCRKREISDLIWPEVNFDKCEITLPGARVKNAHAFIIPLCDQALEVVHSVLAIAEQDRLFSSFSWSRYKKEMDQRLHPKMAPWVLHDIRRSFVTHMGENSFAPPHVIEALVNHVSGTKAGVAGIYNKATYAVEKRQAIALWGQHVDNLVSGRKGKVAVFRPQAA